MFAFLLAAATSKVFIQLNEERSFIHWMRTNNQFYTGDEYHFRLGLYLCRTRWINDFNKGQHTFTVGHNKFSTYTPSEYRSLLGARKTSSIKSLPGSQKVIFNSQKSDKREIPDELDWREKGVVNSIKDQANCGSCWSFATCATSEAAYAIQSGQLFSFSEQNLVDCVTYARGCSGGFPDAAIYYVVDKQDGRFNSEDDYPYEAVQEKCRFDKTKGVGKVKGYIEVNKYDENDLKEKVAKHGVASVCIDAENSQFHAYTSGIFDWPECQTEIPNHAVAVVGYGVDSGIDFWIIRNSWGSNWGEEGYIRMIRNKNNQCGIASEAIVAEA